MYGVPLVASIIVGVIALGFLWSWLSSISVEWLVGIPSTIFLLVSSSILNGWVISCLWDWFITPLGAPHMPLTSALGLSIICQTLLNQETQDHSDEHKKYDTLAQFLIATFSKIVVSRLAILMMGWVITLFQ